MRVVGAIFGAGFVIILLVVMACTTSWQEPEEIIVFVSQNYSFESSTLHQSQVKRFLWFFDHTKIQYQIRNTDSLGGTFSVSFVFDNGKIAKPVNTNINLAPKEVEVITADAPWGVDGRSSVNVTVDPPKKSIPQKQIVMKTVTVADKIGLGWIPALFR